MSKEVTRSIKPNVAIGLWARSAGRCEFNNCNRPLYKSPVTQEQGNISEKAHIWSFSPDGPRGWPKGWKKGKGIGAINELANLMLLCHDCHKIIDQDKLGKRYSAKLLAGWKEEHERRVAIVTGVDPSRKSNVVLYGANIGDEKSLLQPEAAKEALFPDWYPSEERPTILSMSWEGRDDKKNYWKTEAKNLKDSFDKKIRPLIEAGSPSHFSIFGFAPMPLLILLGTEFTDKVACDVFQLHREPFQSWRWQDSPKRTKFLIRRPQRLNGPPALILSLSDSIAHERVESVLEQRCSIWEMTINSPNNDFLKSRDDLSSFRSAMRFLMVEIGKAHGKRATLHIFPAMPVACSVELGRIRMPKAEMPWIIFDQNQREKSFVRALKIGRS